MKQHLIMMLLITSTLTACGEFAYKRGASATDLQQAKKECSSISNEQKAADCLEAKGWSVNNLDDSDLFAIASYSESNPNQTPNKTTSLENIEPAEPAKPTPYEESKEVVNKEVKEVNTVAKKAPNPLDKYKINSWWKMGSNGQSLETAINECVSTLGEAHRPDSKTQLATRGLAVCMREKGWRGLITQEK
jgi:hypothetical protein